MLIVHIASGLLIAIGSAACGWLADYSVLASFVLYVLGGNVGVAGSAALHILGASRRDSTRSR